MDGASAPGGFEPYGFSSFPAYCCNCQAIAAPDRCLLAQHTLIALAHPGLGDRVANGSLFETDFSFNSSHRHSESQLDTSGNSWSDPLWDRSSWTCGSGNFIDHTTESTGWFSNQELDLEMPDVREQPSHAVVEIGGKHHESAKPSNAYNRPESPDAALPYSIERSMVHPITAATEPLLVHLWERCHREARLPLPREIQGLAVCEGVAASAIEAWFMNRLSSDQSSTVSNETRSVPVPHLSSRNTDHAGDTEGEWEIIRRVREHARQKFHSDCLSTQSMKSADAGGRYLCTSGCGFSTNVRDTWQRHEQLWQPQEFWHCVLCRRSGQQPAICSRKNKLFQHFNNCHKDVSQEERNRLRNESKVDYQAGYERTCKFWTGSGTCKYRFTSWNDRVEHYLRHFNETIPDGPWRLRFRRNDWFDDDDENGGTDHSYTGSMKSQDLQATTSSHSTSCPKPSYSRRSTGVSARQNFVSAVSVSKTSLTRRTRKIDGSSRILPEKLINVATLSWSSATADSKYVALERTQAQNLAQLFKTATSMRNLGYEAALLELSRTCSPFKETLAIVSNMGYHYLWIDDICETNVDLDYTRTLYEQAVLTVILVETPEMAKQITHYTCHYDNVKQVRAWATQSLPIEHVQILGHGAFGVVDEVQLGTASDFYARKMLLGPKAHKMLKRMQLQEIEIMQKMRHENIAEFIAAYSDHRSLNILMRPVAECSLKDFLAEPSRWADKFEHIPRWFCSLASAVSYMHGISLRHKDIKPGNILIRGREVYLSDFGTARDFSTSVSGSEGDARMTPKYCAPEVAQKEYRGRKADIFSLGCVFLELATVHCGMSLEDLNHALGYDEQWQRKKIVYCRLLGGCARWSDSLFNTALSRFQRTSLRLSRQMLSRNPAHRPSASEVYEILLGTVSLLPSTRIEEPPLMTGQSSLSAPNRSRAGDRILRAIRPNFAPEAVNLINVGADVWSFGGICSEIACWLMSYNKARVSASYSTLPSWCQKSDFNLSALRTAGVGDLAIPFEKHRMRSGQQKKSCTRSTSSSNTILGSPLVCPLAIATRYATRYVTMDTLRSELVAACRHTFEARRSDDARLWCTLFPMLGRTGCRKKSGFVRDPEFDGFGRRTITPGPAFKATLEFVVDQTTSGEQASATTEFLSSIATILDVMFAVADMGSEIERSGADGYLLKQLELDNRDEAVWIV